MVEFNFGKNNKISITTKFNIHEIQFKTKYLQIKVYNIKNLKKIIFDLKL